MNSMKKGDRVITKSGLHGKVMELNNYFRKKNIATNVLSFPSNHKFNKNLFLDNTCVIETLAGKLKIERTAISIELSSKLNLPPSKK